MKIKSPLQLLFGIVHAMSSVTSNWLKSKPMFLMVMGRVETAVGMEGSSISNSFQVKKPIVLGEQTMTAKETSGKWKWR